ncbi:PAS-domain containing protein [Paraburkholderia hospita]|uniref:PAS-domain containing protein n=1 Tax=Paraburkholderia hospita TaxID=169430 RepID=UPI001FCA3DE0|nr:PAS-domain containing protein [Paraburkholderia hospita]
MPHGLCTLDEDDKVIIANRRTAELFGATVERLELNVPLPESIGHVGPAQFGDTLRQQMVERCTAWLAGERNPLDLELCNGRQLEITHNPVPDGSAVIVIEDVTERREIWHVMTRSRVCPTGAICVTGSRGCFRAKRRTRDPP